jgi:hypothetical protein
MKFSKKQLEVIEFLKQKNGEVSYSLLQKNFNQSTINALLGKEVITLKTEGRFREDDHETIYYTVATLDTFLTDGYSITVVSNNDKQTVII